MTTLTAPRFAANGVETAPPELNPRLARLLNETFERAFAATAGLSTRPVSVADYSMGDYLKYEEEDFLA